MICVKKLLDCTEFLAQELIKMTSLVIINTIILVFISLLHFYWAVGGKYGSVAVLPSKPNGQLLFKPGVLSTLAVAFGLLFFALITLGNLSVFDPWIELKYVHSGTWIIGFVFIIRAIGDFRFIGFFKSIKGTDFARNDTRIYSPLSLMMGVISLLIVTL